MKMVLRLRKVKMRTRKRGVPCESRAEWYQRTAAAAAAEAEDGGMFGGVAII